MVDEELAVPSTLVLTTVSESATDRLPQLQNVRAAGNVTESNHPNGVIKTESEKTATEDKSQTAGLVTSLTKKPEKPEKPERKFNSRELIEKQRNWTSHFSKSRSSRYNSDPNKTEVRVGLSAGGAENKGAVVGSQQRAQKLTADSSLPSTNPAARSASFSSTRPVRSPTVSPPPPPIRAGQAASPVSPTRQEKKVERPSEPSPLASPVRDTISARYLKYFIVILCLKCSKH
jgi:neurabin